MIIMPMGGDDEAHALGRFAAQAFQIIECNRRAALRRLAAIYDDPVIGTDMEHGALAEAGSEQSKLNLISRRRCRPITPN